MMNTNDLEFYEDRKKAWRINLVTTVLFFLVGIIGFIISSTREGRPDVWDYILFISSWLLGCGYLYFLIKDYKYFIKITDNKIVLTYDRKSHEFSFSDFQYYKIEARLWKKAIVKLFLRKIGLFQFVPAKQKNYLMHLIKSYQAIQRSALMEMKRSQRRIWSNFLKVVNLI